MGTTKGVGELVELFCVSLSVRTPGPGDTGSGDGIESIAGVLAPSALLGREDTAGARDVGVRGEFLLLLTGNAGRMRSRTIRRTD